MLGFSTIGEIRQNTPFPFGKTIFSPKTADFHLNISFALTAPNNLR
jgi:hypothetical protein